MSIYRYALLMGCLIWIGGCSQPTSHQQRFLQFGTLIDITLITDTDTALAAFDEIEKLLIHRHSQWHGWEDGALKQFNSKLSLMPREGVKIPQILQQLITDSKHYYTLTDGLFNPAMGKLIAAWGFHDHSEPDTVIIKRLKNHPPVMDDLVINQNAYSKNQDLQLDFGAIAKGLAVKQIAQQLNQLQIKNFIINAGGDIFAQGIKPGHQNWRIAIEDPFESGIISSLKITSDTSIFTSGNYQRVYRNKDGSIRHHIISPKTGEPSRNISSATVIHEDPVIADVAATTLMLTDISAAKTMASKMKVVDYLIVTEQKEIYLSPGMMSKLDQSSLSRFTIHLL